MVERLPEAPVGNDGESVWQRAMSLDMREGSISILLETNRNEGGGIHWLGPQWLYVYTAR